MRKIRVICSDPYATDCSSDDEESIEAEKPSNGKLFVQEISISIPKLHLNSISNARLRSGDSSPREDGLADDGPIRINQEIDGTIAENQGDLGREKHPGLRMTASGKWGVQLRHPFRGNKIWYGTFNTIEEATLVYKKKKLEYALLSELNKQKNMLRAKHNTKHRRQKLVVDGVTVTDTESGKWAAWFRDPVSSVIIWLGLYFTPEEAVMSYSRKKLGFDSSCNLVSLGKACSRLEGNPQDNVVSNMCDVASIIDTDVASSRRPGIELTETGRWAVIIQHPSTMCRFCLGFYDTPEEAAEVFDKKKIELEAESESQPHGNKIGGSTSSVGNQERYVFQEAFARGASKSVIDSQGLPVRYKGVRFREPGRWASEIKDPFKRRNVHIGSFYTPEEAADAYNKRKSELEERMSLCKKRKFIDNAEALTEKLASRKIGLVLEADAIGEIIKTEPSNASPSSFNLDADNSTLTAVSSQDSQGSYTNNDNQIPEDEFGFGVINSYGQFIGEYNRIDDELWLIQPSGYDDCGLHGTMEGTEDPSFRS